MAAIFNRIGKLNSMMLGTAFYLPISLVFMFKEAFYPNLRVLNPILLYAKLYFVSKYV